MKTKSQLKNKKVTNVTIQFENYLDFDPKNLEKELQKLGYKVNKVVVDFVRTISTPQKESV
jgi:anaerobic glycerol-3-phosphate dehydrogenase